MREQKNKKAGVFLLLFIFFFSAFSTAFANSYPVDTMSITGLDIENLPGITIYVHVPGLQKPQKIYLYEDNIEIKNFTVKHNPKFNNNLAVVLDRSGSMSDIIGEVKDNIADVLNTADQSTNTALFSFNTQVTKNASGKPAWIIKELEHVTADGGTAVLDALYKAAKWIENEKGAKTITLFTDGADNSSTTPAEKVLKVLKNSGAVLINVGYTGNEGINEKLLSTLADETGGVFIRADNAEQFKTIFKWQQHRIKTNIAINAKLPDISVGTHLIKVVLVVNGCTYTDAKQITISGSFSGFVVTDEMELRAKNDSILKTAFKPLFSIIGWLIEEHKSSFLKEIFKIPVLGVILASAGAYFFDISRDGSYTYGGLLLGLILLFLQFGGALKLGRFALEISGSRIINSLVRISDFYDNAVIRGTLSLFKSFGKQLEPVIHFGRDLARFFKKLKDPFKIEKIMELDELLTKAKITKESNIVRALEEKILKSRLWKELELDESVHKIKVFSQKAYNLIKKSFEKFSKELQGKISDAYEKLKTFREAKGGVEKTGKILNDITNESYNSTEKAKKLLEDMTGTDDLFDDKNN